MSMMTSAVAVQSRSIGSGSAATVPTDDVLADDSFEFARTEAPRRATTRWVQLSKRHAIVYNARPRCLPRKSPMFSAGCILKARLLIL
jgi:hypothetical protein